MTWRDIVVLKKKPETFLRVELGVVSYSSSTDDSVGEYKYATLARWKLSGFHDTHSPLRLLEYISISCDACPSFVISQEKVDVLSEDESGWVLSLSSSCEVVNLDGIRIERERLTPKAKVRPKKKTKSTPARHTNDRDLAVLRESFGESNVSALVDDVGNDACDRDVESCDDAYWSSAEDDIDRFDNPAEERAVPVRRRLPSGLNDETIIESV